jgi:predicted Zn-dependent protease
MDFLAGRDDMADSRKSWSFRRWRRRWQERFASARLRARIWFHRHVLSIERQREWKRRWRRKSDRLKRRVESVGFKVFPHRPDAAPDTWSKRMAKRWDAWVERIYPAASRVSQAAIFQKLWRENIAPLHALNERVRGWIDHYLLANFRPKTFRKRFLNWRGAVIAVTAKLLLVALVFWAVPAWRAHQEQKRAAQAQLLVSRGYYSLAYQNVIRVLRANESHEQASRVLADLLERQGAPDALTWRRKVADINPSVSNRLAWATAAIRFENPPSSTASRLLAEIATTASNTLDYRTVAAQFELRNGNLSQAETHFLAALTLKPADPELELSLATLRLQSRDPQRLALADASLETLAAQTNIGIRALRPLVFKRAASGQYARAKEYSQRILAAENSTFEDRIVHLRVLWESRDPQRESFLRTLQDQVSANAFYTAQLAAWMAANNLARPALAWLDQLPPTVRSAEPILQAIANLHATLGDWGGLEARLIRQRWGTMEFARLAWLSRCYRGLGDRRAAEEHLRRSTELASGMALRLASLFRNLESWGWQPEAESVLEELYVRYPQERWAGDLLLSRFYQRGQTADLKRILALQFDRDPKNIPLKNNLAMMLLLLKTDLPTGHRLAAEVHQHDPHSSVFASTYALSLHLQGRSAEGIAELQKLAPEALKNPNIAVYLTILSRAAGDSAAARQYARWARAAQLLPEERAMFESATRGL